MDFKFGFTLLVLLVSSLIITASVSNITSKEISVPVTSVTIYGNDMAFINRNSVVNLDGGILELKIVNFTKPILDSILINDNNGRILEWHYHTKKSTVTEYRNRTLNFNEILENSTGKEIKVEVYGNKSLYGELAWVGDDKIGIKSDDGVLFINRKDIKEILIYGAITKEVVEVNKTLSIPELVFREESNKGEHDIEISYLAWGANWKSDYKFYTNSEAKKGTGILQAWAIITNNIENWSNINMKLVVGYPIVLYPKTIPSPSPYGGLKYALAKAESIADYTPPNVAERFIAESIGEFCVYELKEKVTLKKGETRYFPLFSGEVEFNKKYLWDTKQGNDVYRIFEIKNSLDNPWAGGIFSVYIKGNFQGQDRIDYTAKDDKVDVKISKAPDINVNKEIMEKITYPEKGEKIGHRIRYSQITYYKVNLTVENFRDEEIDIKIIDYLNSGNQVILKSSTIEPKRILNSLIWEITLPKNGRKEIIYEYEVKNWYYR